MTVAGELLYEGDLLSHRHYDDARKETAIRQVRFEKFDDKNPNFVFVSFGRRTHVNGEAAPALYRVAVDELIKPRPKPPIFAPPPPATAPGPPSSIQAPDIAPLRAALRAAHEQRAGAQEVVDSANQLVQRAEKNLDDARTALRHVTAREYQRAEALEASLRNGSAAAVQDDDTIVMSRESARVAVENAEGVVAKFHTELRDARAKLSEHDGKVHAAATRVLVAIFSRAAAELAELEQRAAKLRKQLQAVDYYVTGDLRATVPNSVASLLANPAIVEEDPIGYEARAGLHNARTARWQDLMQRLTAGDADADL